jgi:hypothetical protein
LELAETTFKSALLDTQKDHVLTACPEKETATKGIPYLVPNQEMDGIIALTAPYPPIF